MSKKIVFLINSMSDGGAEKLVKFLVERLYIEGCFIELICIEKDDVYKINKNIKITYLSSFNKNTSGIVKLFYLPKLAYKLYIYIKKNDIKTVQSHLFRANYINILAKLLFKSNHNVQIVNHGIISRYKNNRVNGKINLLLIKYLYPFANIIISVSNIVQKDMQKLFDFKNKKYVIYNMFDIQSIEQLANERIDNFKFEKNKKYLISVGRLVKLKGNKDLITALSELNDNIELLFIGEGKEKDNLIKLSRELNILNRVHFMGWIENPYKYIRNSDILVSTSKTESFGNVLVESMICKTVVVSTRCGGPEEIIEDRKDGVLVEIGDIDALVDSIELLLNKSSVKDNYILKASEKIKLFDIDNIIREYKKVLKIE